MHARMHIWASAQQARIRGTSMHPAYKLLTYAHCIFSDSNMAGVTTKSVTVGIHGVYANSDDARAPGCLWAPAGFTYSLLMSRAASMFIIIFSMSFSEHFGPLSTNR